MHLISVLESKGNVTLFKTAVEAIKYMRHQTKSGELYIGGCRKMIKANDDDLVWEIKEHKQRHFHSSWTSENYHFKIQQHEI